MDLEKALKLRDQLETASGRQWKGTLRRGTKLQVGEEPEDIISRSSQTNFSAKTEIAARRLAEAYVAIGAVRVSNSTLYYTSLRDERSVSVSITTLNELRRRDPKKPLGDITSTALSGLAQVRLVEPSIYNRRLAVLSDEGRDAIRFFVAYMRANAARLPR